MAQMPAYRSRYGDTITDLLSRRGDIAAAGALRSGDIWGSTVGNLGAIAGQAVQGYAQVQQEKKQAEAIKARDAAIADIFSSEAANDPQQLFKALIHVTDPKSAMAMAEGAAELKKMSTAGDPKMAMSALPGIARGFMAAPDSLKPRLWGVVRQSVISSGIAKPEELPEQYDPETVKGYVDFALGLEKPEKPQGLMPVAPGTRVFDPNTRQEVFAAPERPEKPAADVEGRMIRAEERREERAIAAEQRKAEASTKKAEETAKAAAKETNSQVESAFAAMDAALKEVERLSGTKALTSPLESANARQQYQAAASAFAATLSRATGDSRISDLDRKAYAGLLAYAGPGSTLLNITRPDLARKRFTEAKKFFSEAARARAGESVGGTDEEPPE